MYLALLSALYYFPYLTRARQITFPPLAALSDPVNIYGGHGGSKEIIFDQEFYGLKTFANLPYVNCLADRDAVNGTYDIAVVGAPFDTVSKHQSFVPFLLTFIKPDKLSPFAFFS